MTHFKIITHSGDRLTVRDAKTTINPAFKMYLSEKIPYLGITGFSDGRIECDHDLELGQYSASVEIYDLNGTYKKQCSLDVQPGIIVVNEENT